MRRLHQVIGGPVYYRSGWQVLLILAMVGYSGYLIGRMI